jgi:hypothetical protein
MGEQRPVRRHLPAGDRGRLRLLSPDDRGKRRPAALPGVPVRAGAGRLRPDRILALCRPGRRDGGQDRELRDRRRPGAVAPRGPRADPEERVRGHRAPHRPCRSRRR